MATEGGHDLQSYLKHHQSVTNASPSINPWMLPARLQRIERTRGNRNAAIERRKLVTWAPLSGLRFSTISPTNLTQGWFSMSSTAGSHNFVEMVWVDTSAGTWSIDSVASPSLSLISIKSLLQIRCESIHKSGPVPPTATNHPKKHTRETPQR